MELPDTHVLSHGLVFHVLLLLLQLLPLVHVMDTNLNIVLTATLSVIAGLTDQFDRFKKARRKR